MGPNKGDVELKKSTTGSVVVESPVQKAKDLPSLTADCLNMFTPREIMLT